MKKEPEIYLGDAVYASHDGFHVWIWKSNGEQDSEAIALDPSVLNSLNVYAKRKQDEGTTEVQ